MSPNEIKKADLSLRISFWLITLGLLVFVVAPLFDSYESRVLPVVKDFRIMSIEQRDRSVRIAGDMHKARDCKFLGLTWYVGDPSDRDAPRERLRFRFMDQPKDVEQNRVEGRQYWGPWELFRPVEVKGPYVFMRVTHSCHRLFDTTGIYLLRPAVEIFGSGYH